MIQFLILIFDIIIPDLYIIRVYNEQLICLKETIPFSLRRR